MTWIDAPDGVLALRRGADFACAINHNDHPVQLPTGLEAAQPIAVIVESPTGILPAAAAGWLRTDPRTANTD